MQDREQGSARRYVRSGSVAALAGVLLAGVVASGCKHEVVAVGSCSIRADSQGQPILECPDGTSRNLARQLEGDGVCSVLPKDGGVVEMKCSDGRTHVFDGKTELAPGTGGCKIVDGSRGRRQLVCGTSVQDLSTDCSEGFPGDVYLTDPQAIDTGIDPVMGDLVPQSYAFSFYLFRLSGCRRIAGDLIIEAWDEPTLPVSIELLQSVGGGVRIVDNQGLKQARLPSLETVGDAILVSNNTSLETLAWKPGLRVDGNISVESNNQLPECQINQLFEETILTSDAYYKDQMYNMGVCP